MGGGRTVTRSTLPGTNGGRSGTNGVTRDDLIFLGVFWLVGGSLMVVNALSAIDELAKANIGTPPWQPVVWESSSVLVIGALVPAVMWMTRRFPPRRPPPWGWIGVHALGMVLFSLVHVVGMGLLRALAYSAVGDRYDPLAPLGNWLYELRKDVLIYAALMASYAFWCALRAQPAPSVEAEPTLEVRDGARRTFVPAGDILWIEAAGNYVELHRAASALLHRASLQEIEQRLAGAGFQRIHRSRLVRRAAIAAIETTPSGDFTVTLTDGRQIGGSRRFRAALDAPAA